MAARGDASPMCDVDLRIVAEGLPAGQFARKRLLAAAGLGTRLARIVRAPGEAARERRRAG